MDIDAGAAQPRTCGDFDRRTGLRRSSRWRGADQYCHRSHGHSHGHGHYREYGGAPPRRVGGTDRSSGNLSTRESHDVSTPCRVRTTNPAIQGAAHPNGRNRPNGRDCPAVRLGSEPKPPVTPGPWASTEHEGWCPTESGSIPRAGALSAWEQTQTRPTCRGPRLVPVTYG